MCMFYGVLCLYIDFTLKRKCRHFDEIFIIGCIGSCHLTTSSAASDTAHVYDNRVTFYLTPNNVIPIQGPILETVEIFLI